MDFGCETGAVGAGEFCLEEGEHRVGVSGGDSDGHPPYYADCKFASFAFDHRGDEAAVEIGNVEGN